MRNHTQLIDNQLDALDTLLTDHALTDEGAITGTLDGLGCNIRLYGDQIANLKAVLEAGILHTAIAAHPSGASLRGATTTSGAYDPGTGNGTA